MLGFRRKRTNLHEKYDHPEVCAAPSLKSAAAVIEWWHHDWSSAGDTAAAAARRIRQAAQAIKREDHARV